MRNRCSTQSGVGEPLQARPREGDVRGRALSLDAGRAPVAAIRGSADGDRSIRTAPQLFEVAARQWHWGDGAPRQRLQLQIAAAGAADPPQAWRPSIAMRRPCSTQRQRGFTLIEVLLATALLAAGPRAGFATLRAATATAAARRNAWRSATNACARSKVSCAGGIGRRAADAFALDQDSGAAAAFRRRAPTACASSPTCPTTSAAAGPTCTNFGHRRRRDGERLDVAFSHGAGRARSSRNRDRARRNRSPTTWAGALPLSRARRRRHARRMAGHAGRPAIACRCWWRSRCRMPTAATGRRWWSRCRWRRRRGGRRRDAAVSRATHAMRGAALLLVMWLIALLTALVGAFALIGADRRPAGARAACAA